MDGFGRPLPVTPTTAQTLAPHTAHSRAHSANRDAVRFEHSPVADIEPRAKPERPRSAVPDDVDLSFVVVGQGEDPLAPYSRSNPPPLPPRNETGASPLQRSPRVPPLPCAPSPDVATPFPPSRAPAPPLPTAPSSAVDHPYPLISSAGAPARTITPNYVGARPNSQAPSEQRFTPLAPLPANAKPTYTAPLPKEPPRTSDELALPDLRSSQGQVHLSFNCMPGSWLLGVDL